MPWTEEEKQAEKERVTRISGFRVAAHDLVAEINPDGLKARNDRWEAVHGKMTRQQRMEEELHRAIAYVAAGKAPAHISIHIHMAHECGATEEYLLNRMQKAAAWGGAGDGSQIALEAWRIVFRPDLPAVYPTRIVELTSDSVPAS